MNNSTKDDFFGDDDDFKSNQYEIQLEQRSTERIKNEMKLQGYRDAHQKEMENEVYLQLGFDLGYKLFARISFIIGQIRSLAIYLDVFKNDSAFLAQVLNKLDQIESFSEYDKYLQWNKLELNSSSLVLYLGSLEMKLNKFKDHFLNSTFQADFKQNIMSALNDFNLELQTEASLDEEGVNFVNESFGNIKC